jgi:hypothetical protein
MRLFLYFVSPLHISEFLVLQSIVYVLICLCISSLTGVFV